jgi:hypothetical protein
VTLHHLAQAIGVSPVDLIKPDAEALREPQKRRTGNKNRKSRRSGVTDLRLCANPAVSGEDGQQEALVVASYFNADATRSTSRKKKGRVDHGPVESMASTVAGRAARKPRPVVRAGACCRSGSVAVLLAAAGPDEIEGVAVLDEVGVDRDGEARIVQLD